MWVLLGVVRIVERRLPSTSWGRVACMHVSGLVDHSITRVYRHFCVLALDLALVYVSELVPRRPSTPVHCPLSHGTSGSLESCREFTLSFFLTCVGGPPQS
jgi:hypothetical protein